MTRPILTARPMEARSAPALPVGPGWWFEPKWDGFRCLAFKAGPRVTLVSKSGKSLAPFFPEIVDLIAALPVDRIGLDGELIAGDGAGSSFEALQARLHPAESRILRLSREAPAAYVVFDLLVDADGEDLRPRSLAERRETLLPFVAVHGNDRLRLSPGASDPKQAAAWLSDGAMEGVVAKRLDGPYAEGERAMVKVKRQRTADCVVGGYRPGRDGTGVGSLLLGLYDHAGLLHHVGFTSGFAGVDRASLVGVLRKLEGGSGFTGRAPGGPSRWASAPATPWRPLKPELVVEVSFDHVTGERFRHGTRLLRLRPDKAPAQCRMDQLRG